MLGHAGHGDPPGLGHAGRAEVQPSRRAHRRVQPRHPRAEPLPRQELFIYIYIYISIYLSIYLSIYTYIYIYIYIYIYMSPSQPSGRAVFLFSKGLMNREIDSYSLREKQIFCGRSGVKKFFRLNLVKSTPAQAVVVIVIHIYIYILTCI